MVRDSNTFAPTVVAGFTDGVACPFWPATSPLRGVSHPPTVGSTTRANARSWAPWSELPDWACPQ
eukprot:11224853-Lingulodinium_polyedra.AAC.1